MGPTNPAEQYFNRGSWGHDGSQWQKLSLLWGYTDRWHEDLTDSAEEDGTWSRDTDPVPEGYVYVFQFASLQNNTGSRGNVQFRIYSGSAFVTLVYNASPTQYIPDVFVGEVCLKEGDFVRLRMNSCLTDDALLGGVWGYKMAVT